MTLTIKRDCRATCIRQVVRIECPDHARIYTNPSDLQEMILIPGPDHREQPERSVWLREDDAIRAASEGRYGLRVLSVVESPLNVADVA